MVTGGELLLESAALRAIVWAESRVTDEVLGKGERREPGFSVRPASSTLTQLSLQPRSA
jgi:hypothetical protein